MSQEIKFNHEFWDIGDIKMHVVTAGEGRPLILLHGFPELWYSWRKLIPRLAEKFRVIVPDLRGYGQSEITKEGYDLNTLSNDVAELIDKAGGKAILAGHDWGGVIGWHTATVYPDKVEAYIAIAAPHISRYFKVMLTSPKQFILSQYVLFFQIPFIPERLMSMRRGKLLSILFNLSSVRKGACTDEEMDVYRDAWKNVVSIRAGVNYYRKLMQGILKTLWFLKGKKIRCPVCVVWGDNDWFLSKPLTEHLEKYCNQPPDVHIIPNCGHWISQEEPDKLYNIMINFMEKYGVKTPPFMAGIAGMKRHPLKED